MKNKLRFLSMLLACAPMYVANAQEEETAEEEAAPLSISGSADVYFRQNLTTKNVFITGVDGDGEPVLAYPAPTSSFANKPGFALGMANLILAKEGKKSGFVADLVFGTRGHDAVFGATLPTNFLVNQLYAYWMPSDMITLTMGNFNTFLGYEVISPAANFNYSTSYMFSYGPFSHSGAKADFALTDELSLMVGVFNPTDVTDYNKINTYSVGGQLGYSTDAGSTFLNVLYGDQDGNPVNALPKEIKDGAEDMSLKSLFQVDLTTGYNLTDEFYLGFNGTYQSTPTNVKDTDPSGFYGAALYPQYAFSDVLSLGLRSEYVAGFGGFDFTYGAAKTKDNGKYENFTVLANTLSANIKVGDLKFIPEIRYDMASEKVFLDMDGKGTEGLASFLLAAVYSF